MSKDKKTRIVAVIPAHLNSIRFPNKILHLFHNLPMVEHVRRRALLCDTISKVLVATCDMEIADQVRKYGGKVVMTSAFLHAGHTMRDRSPLPWNQLLFGCGS